MSTIRKTPILLCRSGYLASVLLITLPSCADLPIFKDIDQEKTHRQHFFLPGNRHIRIAGHHWDQHNPLAGS